MAYGLFLLYDHVANGTGSLDAAIQTIGGGLAVIGLRRAVGSATTITVDAPGAVDETTKGDEE